MILWVDDVRKAPSDNEYVHVRSVNQAIDAIEKLERDRVKIEYIDMDHDAGDFVSDGGDYVKLLDWLEETKRDYPISIHSMNPVGRNNMRSIIEKNGWTEIR